MRRNRTRVMRRVETTGSWLSFAGFIVSAGLLTAATFSTIATHEDQSDQALAERGPRVTVDQPIDRGSPDDETLSPSLSR